MIIKNLCAVVVSISAVIGIAGEMMQAVDITVPPPPGEKHVRITSDDAKWQSVKSAIPDGPVRCATQIIYADEASVSDGSTRVLESGAFGFGQDFLALRDRFTLQSFDGHLSILRFALQRSFHESASRRTGGKWNEIALIVSKTNLSYCAYRPLVDNGHGRGSLVRCERYFCVGGRCVSVFYERAYKELLKSDLRKKSLSQMAMLEKWEATILNANGNIAFVDKDTAEKRVENVLKSIREIDLKGATCAPNKTRDDLEIDSRKHSSKIVFCSLVTLVCLILFLLRDFVFRRSDSLDEVMDVDRCLRKNAGLRRIISSRMLYEWAVIIHFFGSGNEPRSLCVPAVLYLWKKLFSPAMSESEVENLLQKIKGASGFDKFFSRRCFERESLDTIKDVGYEAAWGLWIQLCEYKFSISERIAESREIVAPSFFIGSVHELLQTWDGKFEGITMLPVDWRVFFQNHPELSDPELLRRYGVLSDEEHGMRDGIAGDARRSVKTNLQDGELAFLDAGKDGVLRGMMWKAQHLVVLDEVDCRLYLPKEWNARPEFETISPCDHIVRLAGSADHEWVSVEHLQLSSEHVNDDLGEWVSVSRNLFGRLNLHAHSTKAAGVAESKEITFERLDRRDALYMKYHNADDMVAFAGTIEISGRLHRLFIVVVRRGVDSWKFEYVLPAADGVSATSLPYRPEEIQSAARIFVPIETFGRAACVICGRKMEDPQRGSFEGKIGIWLKDFFLFDDMQVPKAGIDLPCCASCRDIICTHGVSQVKLESIPQVQGQIAKGASILEVKCGTTTIPLLRTEKSNDSSSIDADVNRMSSATATATDDRAAVMKEMQQESKRLVGAIRAAEENKLPMEDLVKKHIALLGEFRTVFLADATAKKMPPLDRVSVEIQIVGNMKAHAAKIGLPVEGYDKEIFNLRCQIFSPEAVREMFHDEGVPTKRDDVLTGTDDSGHEGLSDGNDEPIQESVCPSLRLVEIVEGKRGRSWPIPVDRHLVIGRSRATDVVVSHEYPAVSARHLDLCFHRGICTAVNLSRVSLTSINGQDLKEGSSTHVNSGDTITLGRGSSVATFVVDEIVVSR